METNGNSNLVIGLGEVGNAICRILMCDAVDKEYNSLYKDDTRRYDAIHICFPYSDEFISQVKTYKSRYTPRLIIIHSTVPIGTSKSLGAVHSPVRGRHPNMEEGIRTFVKFFGGRDAKEAAQIFEKVGVSCLRVANSDSTEAMKIWDTAQYGLSILIEKEIFKFCQERELDFDVVYRYANHTYNEAYKDLGYPEFKKAIISHIPGKIGGHCVIENLRFLKGNPLADLIEEYNAGL